MEDKVMKSLRTCPLFAGMSDVEIELTLDNVPHQLVSLPAHQACPAAMLILW